MNIELTPELLAGIVGAVISLAFSYIPGLSTKYAALAVEVKRAIMALLMLATGVAIYLLGCYGGVLTGVECGQPGITKLVTVVIAAMIANQSIYSLSPKTNAVIDARGQ